MEAQPVALTLILISFPFSGTVNAWPLGEVTITLLLLGLRWWAMGVYALMRRGMEKMEGQPLQVLGLFIALGAMVGTHLWFISNLGAAIVGGALVIWFWQRGIQTVQMREREDTFIQFFRIGFGVLLFELFITVFSTDDSLLSASVGDASLRATATRIFTTFFLSGLLVLSFTRLSGTGDTRATGTAQTAATRNWLVALTFVWGIVVVLSLVLETFSFQFIQMVLQPFWNFLGLLANGIAYVFNWLFGGLFRNLTPKILPPLLQPPGPNPPPGSGAPSFSPLSLLAGRLVILCIALALLLIVVIVFLRRWNVRFREEDEEEVRESLPAREIARQRQAEQRRVQQAAMLETLSPDSVRAHYRDLLQTMAWQKDNLARRPEETPTDYQHRLSSLLAQLPSDTMQNSDTSSDNSILDDLTQAYIEERYADEHTSRPQPTYTHSWVERLAKRLSGSSRKDIS